MIEIAWHRIGGTVIVRHQSDWVKLIESANDIQLSQSGRCFTQLHSCDIDRQIISRHDFEMFA